MGTWYDLIYILEVSAMFSLDLGEETGWKRSRVEAGS